MRKFRAAAVCLAKLVGAVLLLSSFAAIPGARAATGADVWLQTMDSCKQALGGASYQIVSTNGTNFTVATPAASPKTVAPSSNCPLQQGNCVTMSNGQSPVGCIEFADLQPGTYTIHETVTPPPFGSNSEGYAACTGGSACQLLSVTLIVNSDLTAQAWVTNVYPNGATACWPNGPTLPVGSTQTCQQTGVAGYTGTAADPIVTHNFGLAPIGTDSSAPHECDGDSDADDHLSGTPSSHCAYPESLEGTWCGGNITEFPFPWSCTLAIVGTPAPPPPPPASCSSPVTSTFSGTVSANSSQSKFVPTAAAGTLSANVTWTPDNGVNLIIYTSSSQRLGQTGVSSTGNLTETLANMPAATYKIKVMNVGSSSISYHLAVQHC
jgi:hypothetical protein